MLERRLYIRLELPKGSWASTDEPVRLAREGAVRADARDDHATRSRGGSPSVSVSNGARSVKFLLALAFLSGASVFLGFVLDPSTRTLVWSPTWYVAYAICASLIWMALVVRA